MDAQLIQSLVPELYCLVRRLEAAAPGRKFTLDGHLVGSIGEVVAAVRYGLELVPASSKGHDAIAPDGRHVEIKATGKKSVNLRGHDPRPGLHLVVLKLNPDGSADTVYNGPAQPVWDAAGKLQKNGQRPIGLSKLMVLQESVAASEQLVEVS